MDFVDVGEVVSAVLRQLKTEHYEEHKAIMRVEKSIEDPGWNKYYFVITNDELKKLENLLAAVYKMEDFYETFVLRRMHVRRMGFGRRYIFILRQMLNLKATLDFRSEMRKTIFQIDAVFKESSVSRQSRPREESDVLGLEKHKGNMVTWLTDTNSGPNIGFLLISGQTGSGKTTVATEIYKSPEIERHFEFRAWVSASKDPVSNFRSILQQITGDSTVDMKSTEAELEEKICKILQKKRCLVVVDINMENAYDLLDIIPHSALLGEGNGSRVIMTMRSKYRIESFRHEYKNNPSLSYDQLKPLQDEGAWNLFLKKVRLPDNTVESDIPDKLKREIINVCGGNPSAVMTLGRFLSTKKSYEEWLTVLEQLSGSNFFASMNCELTTGMRTCLLYFGVFPKGYEIPVRRLLRLWLAEGFVTEPREQTERIQWDLEKKAEMYLRVLIDRSIIQITKWRKDGSPKTCRMPGVLHDICLSKAQDIFGLLHIHPTTPAPESSSDHASPSPKFGARRVSGDIKHYSSKEYSRMQHLRSYLSFNIQKKDTPAVEISDFLSAEVIGHRGFGMLKVLDLERVYKPKLPHNLGQLYLLRYLGLRWTFLDKQLPHSVSKLHFLETLDVKHTYISSPPNSIWKMNYLRHLCLNEIRLDMPVKEQSISLLRLHTLWGLFVDIKSPVKNGLDGLINLRKLGLTFHLDSVEELDKWISSLKGLESLRLRSKDKNGRPSELKLKPLSGLKNLTDVYLLGSLPELDSEYYFPQGIKVLTLSVSKLKKDPMPILSKLPKLGVLRLLADSYTGNEMVWPSEGFPELTILKLWMLKELVTWTVEAAVTSLDELEIRCCHNLKKLSCPLNLSWTIILTNMPNELEDKLRVDDYSEELIISTLQF